MEEMKDALFRPLQIKGCNLHRAAEDILLCKPGSKLYRLFSDDWEKAYTYIYIYIRFWGA